MRDNHWLCYAISAQIFALVPIIAVMFTFSFSAAFALPDGVSATDAAAKLAEAKTIAEKVIDNYYDAAMKKVLENNVHYTLADEAKIAAAWSKIDVKATLADDIATAYAAEAKNNDFNKYDVDAATYAAKVFGISTKGIYNAKICGIMLVLSELKRKSIDSSKVSLL